MTDPLQNLDIRDGQAQDADILTEYNLQMAWETEARALDPAVLREGVIQGLAQPDRCRYFVADLAGRVVGQAMITYEWSDWRNGELWWLQSVYVHPEFRRMGVFRRLFHHIEQLARQNGRVRGLRLYVEEENEAGMSVYLNLGMIHAGYHVFECEF